MTPQQMEGGRSDLAWLPVRLQRCQNVHLLLDLSRASGPWAAATIPRGSPNQPKQRNYMERSTQRAAEAASHRPASTSRPGSAEPSVKADRSRKHNKLFGAAGFGGSFSRGPWCMSCHLHQHRENPCSKEAGGDRVRGLLATVTGAGWQASAPGLTTREVEAQSLPCLGFMQRGRLRLSAEV